MADEEKNDAVEEEESDQAVATATEDSDDADDKAIEWVEDPKFEIDYKGECAYEVKVSIAASNETKQSEKMFDELRGDAEIPGFRRGRAPRKLVEKKFAKAVKGDVEGRLVSEAFQKLIGDEDLNPIGMPDIDGLEELKEREDGAAIEVTLKFEVSPRCELGKYRGIDIEKPFVKIDEKDVDEQIATMLERNATFEAVEKTKAEDGDQVIMDFKGMIDGEVFEGGSADNYPYILGSGRFFPEFEEVLKGAKAGADLSCDVAFPDDYFSEDLQGKNANFTIKVNEVKRRVVPELTDEIAKDMGSDDAAALREMITQRLKDSAGGRSKEIAESRAIQAVIEDSTYEIPKSVVERIAHDAKEEEIKRLMGMKIPMTIIEERMDEITTNAEETAVRNLKSIVTLNEIGEAEGIEVTEEDWEKHAESMSQQMGLDAEIVAQYLQTSDERNSFGDRIYRSKAIAVIMDNANVTEKELTRDEMDKEEEEAKGDTE